jgi:division protein CdvB (Snf7/Vps24/ESCRT-III family)
MSEVVTIQQLQARLQSLQARLRSLKGQKYYDRVSANLARGTIARLESDERMLEESIKQLEAK